MTLKTLRLSLSQPSLEPILYHLEPIIFSIQVTSIVEVATYVHTKVVLSTELVWLENLAIDTFTRRPLISARRSNFDTMLANAALQQRMRKFTCYPESAIVERVYIQ